MGKKICCETFFQVGLKTLEGEEEMADETVESLSIKFGMILEYLKDIKGSLSELPCDDLGKEVSENGFEIKHLKEDYSEVRKELNEEVYSRLRKVEGKVIKLSQQNEGQDAWSNKIWAMIILIITVALNLLGWFMRS